MLAFKNNPAPKILNSKILNISGIEIQILRKNIKNINFSIKASDGQVYVSAPIKISEEELRLAIYSKLGWIRKKIQANNNDTKEYKRNYQSGETIIFLGKLYKLEVIEKSEKPNISLRSHGVLSMYVREKTGVTSKKMLLNEWYRAELKQRIPALVNKWQPIIGEKVSEWGVKQMKTRWGTCNIDKKRIWLNLELAKQPEECLEYVVVHEMTHLLERNHNARFKMLLDGFIPDWEKTEAILNIKK